MPSLTTTGAAAGRTTVACGAYHSGATEDLAAVHRHLAGHHACRRMGWIGFSLGGNLVLKYLGENGPALDAQTALGRRGFGALRPCDQRPPARPARQPDLYQAFSAHPQGQSPLESPAATRASSTLPKLAAAHTLRAFDDLFTAPVHGFRDAEDYWRRCSALNFLDRIRVPTLVINARNDPFLDGACFPYAAARRNPQLFLETPRSGGHVGFLPRVWNGLFWHEARIVRFAGQLEAALPDVKSPEAVAFKA